MTTSNDKSGAPLQPSKTTPNSEGNFPLPHQERVISFTYPPIKNTDKNREVPVIYLQGNWLKRAGFAIGKQFTVNIEKNRLVITASANGGEQ